MQELMPLFMTFGFEQELLDIIWKSGQVRVTLE